MLKFNKGLFNNQNTKIVTSYNKITDADKIKEIRSRMENKVSISEKINNQDIQNNQVYTNHINALKNIKKD